MDLTDNQYSRQTSLPGFGERGQDALRMARVLVIGAGGLGSPVLPALAGAGVGTLGIVDDDVVEASNLHRQHIHGHANIGQLKVESARASIRALNPATTVRTYALRLTSENALNIFRDYDLVVDGSDNFATRYLANDAAILSGIPLVWGAVSQYGGQVSVAWAAKGPHYRDLFPVPPAPGSVLSCAEGGVLPTVCTVIGGIMATETIKIITGIGKPLLGRVTLFDALSGTFRELPYASDPTAPPVTELIDYALFCGDGGADTITPEELESALASPHQPTLIDVREPEEWAVSSIPGAVLMPLNSLAEAFSSLPRDADIIVYCQRGGRSASALTQLQEHHFTSVRHLSGGIEAWESYRRQNPRPAPELFRPGSDGGSQSTGG
ncbi:ThiF family adenylyltransferase [Curtobacterium sp. ISL-83]|uniref:ThiF family adenylyltransferase n=1 Tax=Curtobacterium sp. ISL-83 TaxID=2819145 RepID=UPI001BE6EBEE|nr:ThiF family adenylyltransferase [Curtobacterium sp. ISL-83]MBT2502862.1 ThiF family adenylyltransferase [Curtobacterium sp. ISL-83]